MICQYCKSAYKAGDRQCQSCGASKGPVIQPMLDSAKDNTSWLENFRMVTTRVAIITAILLGLNLVFANWQTLRSGTYLWTMIITPILLLVTTVKSLKQGIIRASINFILSIALWIGVILGSVVLVASLQSAGG